MDDWAGDRAVAPTPPPTAGRIDHQDLRRFLNALRLQLWWREALGVVATSALLGALVGAAALVWPMRRWSGQGPDVAAWLLVAAVALGVSTAVLRRPSVFRAAQVADRQLRTDSRLATAAEVLQGRLGGSLAPAQLEDAWRTASGISPWRAYPHGWRRVEVAAAGLLASLALLALSMGGAVGPLDLPGLPAGGDFTPGQTGDTDTVQPNSAALVGDSPALPADRSSNPAAAAQTLEDVQYQAAHSQAAETALHKLADALRPTAAARDVGEALRAGKYDDAAARLNTLAQQSDQLSRQAKRELASAMQRVAIDSAKLDPPLAVAEDRVARALNRQVYTETRTSLENLARAIGDAKRGIVSQEALAQQLDQLQQQQQVQGGGGDIGESEQGYIPDIPGEQPKQAGLVQGVSSTIQVPGPEGDPNSATHSSVGQEAGGDPLGDLSSRLTISALDMPVEMQLSNDQGGNKPNPQAPTVKISETSQNGVRPSDVAQPGDPVQDVAEQLVEPTEHRDAVRSFFKATGETTTAGP